MKDVLLVIVLLIAVGLSVVVVRFNEKAIKASKNLEEERYSRMVAEESLQKNAAKLATLEAQVKSADAKMNKVQDIIDQEKGVNSDLKKQYDKLAQSKAELEAKLKAALDQQTAQTQAAAAASQQQAAQATAAAAQAPAAATVQ